MTESARPRLDIALVLLIVAAFLAPIVGGGVSTETQMLLPGIEGFLPSLMGGADIPLSSALLVGVFALSALGIAVARHRILQIPMMPVTPIVAGFFGILVVSVTMSSFRAVSFASALTWILYAVGFFATVALAGRKRGPRWICAAIFLGCLVISVLGIREYGDMRSTDPTWRIFSTWQPNSLAAMLLVGFFLGVGLTAISDRLSALLCGLGTMLIGFALVLTQSKGAFLALGFGLVVATILFIVFLGRDARKGLTTVVALAALVGALAFALTARPASANPTAGAPAGGTALSRMSNASGTQEQSAGFRRLLWQGTIDIVRDRPMGIGIGAYRFDSSRAGLTTQTHLSHNAYLQVAAEASPLALFLLLALGVLWTAHILRSGRKVAADSSALRAAVFAAVASVMAHSVIDSNLYYFGIGFCVFVLLGVGLLLSADAVAPEFVAPPIRVAVIVGLVGTAILLGGQAYGEALRARVRFDEKSGDMANMRTGADLATKVSPNNGDAWYLLARVAASPDEQMTAMARAAALSPSTRNLRALARLQLQKQQFASAISTLNQALRRDPNNLLALTQLIVAHDAGGSRPEALRAAERLIGVEQTPYFKVRSQPDLIPTETYLARLYLAEHTEDPKAKAALLQGAVDGLLNYAKVTVPYVRRNVGDNPNMDFAGESLGGMESKLQRGKRASQDLVKIYRVLGDTVKVTGAEGAEAAFDEAIGALATALGGAR